MIGLCLHYCNIPGVLHILRREESQRINDIEMWAWVLENYLRKGKTNTGRTGCVSTRVSMCVLVCECISVWLWICVCVCLWMCVYEYMCVFDYVYVFVCECVQMCVCVCEQVCITVSVCEFIYEYVSVCPGIYMWTCVYVYECVYEHVSMDMCVSEWVCACVCDGGTWHDHLSSSPLEVSQCPSCYALYLSRLTSHMWQSGLAESGSKGQACLLQALWPYASHWASLYLSILSCKRQIALLHRIGERKQQGLSWGCITCASFTLPLRFSLMAVLGQGLGWGWH